MVEDNYKKDNQNQDDNNQNHDKGHHDTGNHDKDTQNYLNFFRFLDIFSFNVFLKGSVGGGGIHDINPHPMCGISSNYNHLTTEYSGRNRPRRYGSSGKRQLSMA